MGWKGVDTYLLILSKLIKIAQFIVVQQAFNEVQPADKFAEFEDNRKNYRSKEEEEEEEGSHSREAGWTEVGNVSDIGDWLIVNREDNAKSDNQAHQTTQDRQYSKGAVRKRYSDTESMDIIEPLESRHSVIEAVAQRMD